jgi:dTDP-4-amino-4,6-dideoxygalactose transaminase
MKNTQKYLVLYCGFNSCSEVVYRCIGWLTLKRLKVDKSTMAEIWKKYAEFFSTQKKG